MQQRPVGEASLALHEASDDSTFLLAILPPTAGQRRLALAVIVVLLVAFAITAPFMNIQLPSVSASIPALETAISINDLITSALLFSQFLIVRRRALLALASGYLFTALIVIPHELIFPGAFTPTGLFDAGLQSSAWLYTFWHAGFPLAVIGYVLLREADGERNIFKRSPVPAIALSVAAVVVIVGGLTWLATNGEWLLPRIFLDRVHADPSRIWQTGAFDLALTAIALAQLWFRRRSVLDLWLMVVCCTWLLELTMTATFLNTRYSVGWYASRIYALTATIFVLIVLLSQTTALYARLLRSNTALQRERNNKLVNLEALAASISHEVNQPLAAISANSGAALGFLEHAPPNLEEARLALNDIASDSHRASQIFQSIRSLFGRSPQGREQIDLNQIALEVLHTLRSDLEEHGIAVHAELSSELPLVMGQRGQLQEVLLNLVQNAIEAMDSIKDGDKFLRVRTQSDGRDTIAVAVEDTGSGIPPEKLDEIFDAFITTKPKGMGLGLAICRMIIEQHGGKLSAWSDKKRRGALLQFTLPIKSAAGPL